MRSTHRIIVAAALAVSVAAGTAAATRTVHLGADTRDATPISASALAAQKAKLAAADHSIDKALAARPPALPRVPRFHPLGKPSVPPLLVTRVVPMTSPAVTADTGDAPPAADAGSHRRACRRPRLRSRPGRPHRCARTTTVRTTTRPPARSTAAGTTPATKRTGPRSTTRPSPSTTTTEGADHDEPHRADLRRRRRPGGPVPRMGRGRGPSVGRRGGHPRVAALNERRAQVRQDAADAKRVVAARWEHYEARLAARRRAVDRAWHRRKRAEAAFQRRLAVARAHRPVIVRTVYARPGASGSAPAYSAPSGSGGGYSAPAASPGAPSAAAPAAAPPVVSVGGSAPVTSSGSSSDPPTPVSRDGDRGGAARRERFRPRVLGCAPGGGAGDPPPGGAPLALPRRLAAVPAESREADRRGARAGRGRGARARRPGEHRRAVRPHRSRRRGGGGLRPLIRADAPGVAGRRSPGPDSLLGAASIWTAALGRSASTPTSVSTWAASARATPRTGPPRCSRRRAPVWSTSEGIWPPGVSRMTAPGRSGSRWTRARSASRWSAGRWRPPDGTAADGVAGAFPSTT